MVICLDYDATYTRDPALWDGFIAAAKDAGHSVIGASMRYPHETGPELEELMERLDAFHFTARSAKKYFLEALGVKPDIWIDDSPFWLYEDAIR